MTIADAKALDINELLIRLGHQTTRHTIKDTWYKRPYGVESHASFHVSKDGRAWFDFGTGQGGNIIDLAMLLGECSEVAQALAYLESVSGQLTNRFTPISQLKAPESLPAYRLDQHQPLSDSKGLAFLRSRALDPKALAPYLSDVYFHRACQPTKQTLYGVGLANLSGGFELRAQLEGTLWHKTTLGTKDISAFILKPTAAWLCFEGLPDFGSFLTVDKPPLGTFNYLILNGTGMTAKAIDFLNNQPVTSLIICSQAGDGAKQSKEGLLTWALQQGWPSGDIDHKWQGFGDYNEKLMYRQGLLADTPSSKTILRLKLTPKTGF